MDAEQPTLPGLPTPDGGDPEAASKLASEVLRKHTQYKSYRQPHEGTWFVNAAMLRGQQKATYDADAAMLVVPQTPSYAIDVPLNKIMPKHKARLAKFFKNRPRPVAVPASTDYQDLMDARATEIAIRYQMERLGLETLYRRARLWASVCGRAYWWFGYDENALGRVKQTDEFGKEIIQAAVLGDLTVEVGTAFEVLVADPTLAYIGDQPEVQRVRTLPRKDALAKFPVLAEEPLSSEGAIADTQSTRDKLAGLKAGQQGLVPVAPHKDEVLLIEHFVAPCASYPQGRRIVVCGGKLVAHEDRLPFEFWDSPTNPYPCVEFLDLDSPGQYWSTTFIEQLVPLQRALNRVVELTVENIEAVSRPKMVVYKQHKLPDGAYTSAAGEILELTWIPGLPEPRVIQPASVSGDCWNIINLLLKQFDDISQIHTASEGGGSGQESGYQTNLLQEATDAVHAPDIRRDELAIEEAAWKMRRIMKLTYDVPRLVAIGGEHSLGEMVEFSSRQINDAAEIRIQTGSMLPDLKAARAQAAMELYKSGMLGDPADPLVRRKALSMIDAIGYDTVHPDDRRDDDEAQRETRRLMQGQPVEPAKFFHNHVAHLADHESEMKTPEFESLPGQVKVAFYAHVISHYDWTNLPLAMGLRSQFGLSDLPIASPPPPPQSPTGPGAPAPPAAPGAPAPAPSGPPLAASPQMPAIPQA